MVSYAFTRLNQTTIIHAWIKLFQSVKHSSKQRKLFLLMLDCIFILGSSCNVDLDSRISCELTAENTCPTYCCQDEDDCYERKGNPFSWITL